MMVLNSEQILRAESEHGARSTELHGCYRRLLKVVTRQTETSHSNFSVDSRNFKKWGAIPHHYTKCGLSGPSFCMSLFCFALHCGTSLYVKLCVRRCAVMF